MFVPSPEQARRAAQIGLRMAKARGVTWSGAEFWTDEEEAILRAYHPNVRAEYALLQPKRTLSACYRRANKLGLTTQYKFWTLVEIKKLFKVYPSADRPTVLNEFPGRSWRSIERQAIRCKLHRPRRPPVACGVELIDKVRERAFEDNVRFVHLDLEIGGKYFSRPFRRKRPNYQTICRALEFFGGRLVIDWMDE